MKAYEAALQRETPPTLAILRIPRLKLEVPVYHPRRGRTRRRQRVAAFLMVRLAAIDAFGWLRARQGAGRELLLRVARRLAQRLDVRPE